MISALQDKTTGLFSFARIFGFITGLTGNAIIIAGLYSTLAHAEPRLPLSHAFLYGGLALLLAVLVYTGNAVRLANKVVGARLGVTLTEEELALDATTHDAPIPD